MTPAELTRRTPLPRHEAERLLAVAMRLPRSKAITRRVVPGSSAAAFRRLVARRQGGEPLQYIEGSVPFGPIDVLVDSRVLIPRPETEQLYALVASWGSPGIVVDMCTGSGCLGLALAATHRTSQVHLTDVSADALEVARVNAAHNDVDAQFWQGDCYAALPPSLRGRVDLFVANPPYVAADVYETLDRQIVDHEPRGALVAGRDGLDVLRRIAAGLPEWLAPGGAYGVEIGHDQASAVLESFSLLAPSVVQDVHGRDRFVIGSTSA